MSTKEARKLFGKQFESLSDAQVDAIVSLLDVVAKEAVLKVPDYSHST